MTRIEPRQPLPAPTVGALQYGSGIGADSEATSQRARRRFWGGRKSFLKQDCVVRVPSPARFSECWFRGVRSERGKSQSARGQRSRKAAPAQGCAQNSKRSHPSNRLDARICFFLPKWNHHSPSELVKGVCYFGYRTETGMRQGTERPRTIAEKTGQIQATTTAIA